MTTKTSQVTISTVGIDIGKNRFHIIGFDERGALVLRQKLSRSQIAERFAKGTAGLTFTGSRRSTLFSSSIGGE